MKIEIGPFNPLSNILVYFFRLFQVFEVRTGEGRFSFFFSRQEVEDLDCLDRWGRVRFEEVFEVTDKGGEGRFEWSSDRDLWIERLRASFFPED